MRMRCWLPIAFWCALVCARSLESQVGYAGRGPEFYLVDGARISHIDTRSSALLTRRIALSLTNATIPEALDAIGRQAGLRFSYTLDAIPTDAHITLRAEEISVGSALGAVLMDLKVDIELTSTGLATVVAKRPAETLAPGRIAGRVTESHAHSPIAQVVVRVDGTTLGAATMGVTRSRESMLDRIT
jgi:hypothetical protein